LPKSCFSLALPPKKENPDTVLDEIIKKFLINSVKKNEYQSLSKDQSKEEDLQTEKEIDEFLDNLDQKKLEKDKNDKNDFEPKENTEEDNTLNSKTELMHKYYNKTNLEDYNLFYTSKNNLYLVDLSKNIYQKEINSSSCIGKLNLIEKLLYSRFKNYQTEVMNINEIFYFMAYNFYENTRYVFLEYSKNLNVLVVGNRSGDIQIYELVLHR